MKVLHFQSLVQAFHINLSRIDAAAELRSIPLADLYAEIESWQWLALELADVSDGSRVYIERQLDVMVSEVERRHLLAEKYVDDPLRPAVQGLSPGVRARMASIKQQQPIERFCREILHCDLIPAGQNRLKACCPLPGHTDHTPSFYVYLDTGSAWCFGCQRGGDVISLARLWQGFTRFTDALTWLERLGGGE